MIIQLKNFGPIEHFEFDTEKQMHFIFGENNIGKSYAISAVYLILKNWKNSEALFSSEITSDFDTFNKSVLKKIKNSKEEINISEELNRTINHFFLMFQKGLYQSLENTFNTLKGLSNKYSREKFSITIETELFKGEISQEYESFPSIAIYLNFKSQLIKNGDNKYQYYVGKYYSQDFYIDDVILSLNSFNWAIKHIINQCSKSYFLPSSRSGIYNGLSGLSTIIVQISQLKKQLPNQSFEIPSLTEPISDYFLNIASINQSAYNTDFSYFAKRIEDTIIKGKINFDKSNKKLYYEPSNIDLSLELSNVSSMVSEIAPIIAYLKFIIDKEEENPFAVDADTINLFIEEPEAHLHPKVQVELIKLFAELSGKGLNIIMTSHSNYMFNKLSNMILAKEIDPEKISVGLMKMGKKGSYIDKNSMKMDTEGIEDDNFSDVAEELYMERLKLYEQTH